MITVRTRAVTVRTRRVTVRARRARVSTREARVRTVVARVRTVRRPMCLSEAVVRIAAIRNSTPAIKVSNLK